MAHDDMQRSKAQGEQIQEEITRDRTDLKTAADERYFFIFSSEKADAQLPEVCRHQQNKCRVSLPKDPKICSPGFHSAFETHFFSQEQLMQALI